MPLWIKLRVFKALRVNGEIAEVVETRASDPARQGADQQTCLFLSDGTEVLRDDAGGLILSTTGERLTILDEGDPTRGQSN
ncbi:hypothetical protein [Novosphingobium sp. EMRT-2]|uniref:hypothetical protein n=1 Tax=Novosphingobium sp. EMRT-2 TaxID=2571749 RepID=UPI0010BD700B|nr:hypothetical protein [Novosphingobium sp. EMRT-2]QCI95981.1 hypothetical protein FA702_20360 [Novosphingobium sp. EMRT-2]